VRATFGEAFEETTMSDTAGTNDLNAATAHVAARKLYDRAVRTFVDGDSHHSRRLRTALKRRRAAGRRRSPRAYPTRSAGPRPGDTRDEQVARLRLEIAAMKVSSH
jgi:hypothetical protein